MGSLSSKKASAKAGKGGGVTFTQDQLDEIVAKAVSSALAAKGTSKDKAKAKKVKVKPADSFKVVKGTKPGFVEIRFYDEDGEPDAMPSDELKEILGTECGFVFNFGNDGNGKRYWGREKMLSDTVFGEDEVLDREDLDLSDGEE